MQPIKTLAGTLAIIITGLMGVAPGLSQSADLPLCSGADAAGGFAGVWRRAVAGGGGEYLYSLSVSPDGRSVTGTYLALPPSVTDIYGVKPGDWAIHTERDGMSLYGEMHVFFPLIFRDRCPDLWDQGADFEMTLSADGWFLRGGWTRTRLDADCSLSADGWQAEEWVRASPQDIADANGSRMYLCALED